MIEWDRSRDWVLIHTFHEGVRITIRFHEAKPSLAELVAIRRCLPQFRHLAPAELRASLGDSGKLPLGEMHPIQGRPLIEALQKQGLNVLAEGASYTTYLPFDRSTGCGWIIEIDAEVEAVVQSMLAAGVPVQHVEA